MFLLEILLQLDLPFSSSYLEAAENLSDRMRIIGIVFVPLSVIGLGCEVSFMRSRFWMIMGSTCASIPKLPIRSRTLRVHYEFPLITWWLAQWNDLITTKSRLATVSETTYLFLISASANSCLQFNRFTIDKTDLLSRFEQCYATKSLQLLPWSDCSHKYMSIFIGR